MYGDLENPQIAVAAKAETAIERGFAGQPSGLQRDQQVHTDSTSKFCLRDSNPCSPFPVPALEAG